MRDITEFNSIKDVPPEDIHATSADKKTLVLKDGTKVSNELIGAAKVVEKTKAASVSAAASIAGKELLDDPDFTGAVRLIAEEAAHKAIDEEKAKSGK